MINPSKLVHSERWLCFTRVRLMMTNCQRHSLAVPRAGERSYVTGSIRGWSRSHLTYVTDDCSLKERKLTSQSPSIVAKFSVQYNLKITSVIYYLYTYNRPKQRCRALRMTNSPAAYNYPAHMSNFSGL